MRRFPAPLARSAFLAAATFLLLIATAWALTITVDGNPGDWTPSSAYTRYTDRDESGGPNDIPNNVDISDVYFTHDSTHLFWRIDTFDAPTRWTQLGGLSFRPFIIICMDSDNNTSTGFTYSVCNNQQGVDYFLRLEDTDSPADGQPNVLLCNTPSCMPPASSGATVGFNNGSVNEVGLPLADIGITPTTCTGPTRTIQFAVYFDNGSTPPDDTVPNGGQRDVTIDCPALPVEMESFEAEAAADHVAVRWTTVYERDNLGFNLYRDVQGASVPETPLNAALIPSESPGSGQGASYEYLDHEVAEGTVYYYWLEDVDTSGTTTLHGPVSVLYGSAPTAVTLGELGSAPAPAPLVVLLGVAAVALLGVALRRR